MKTGEGPGSHALEKFTSLLLTAAWARSLALSLAISFGASFYAFKKLPRSEIEDELSKEAQGIADLGELIKEQNALLREQNELLRAAHIKEQNELLREQNKLLRATPKRSRADGFCYSHAPAVRRK